ncbi:MAG: sodium:solute symporter family protein [Acidobacteria bacterium]|nr:sodium:solute symporter family protein [Acidobacteriota bacterium]
MTVSIVIIIYLLILFCVGLYLARRVKTGQQFMVADRSLPIYVLVFTLLATWIGSGDVFSTSDLSYNHGYSSLIGSAGGWVGIIIVYWIAGRVRRFGQFTVPDILEARYDHRARILATITTIIAYVTIVSYQFRGGGWLLNIISNGKIEIPTGIIITAVFVVAYTVLAGLVSVAYLDLINGIVILVGLFVSLPFLVKFGGGVSKIAANATPRADFFLGNLSIMQALGYFLPVMLLALANGNMYQRFFSAKSEEDAKKSVIGWVAGVIFIGVSLQTIAVIGSSIYKDLPKAQSGKIIVMTVFNGLPEFIAPLMLAGIAAIIISTANSFLLVPATNVVRDIYQRFINPKLSERKTLWMLRLVVFILGFLAYVLIQFYPRILNAAYAAYTVYGAAITPALMATFFWKRATVSGGVWSIAGGTVVTVFWEVIGKINGVDHYLDIPAVYPALGISILLLVVVSLVGSPPPEDKVKPFSR